MGKQDGHLEENTNFDVNNHQLDGMVHEQTNQGTGFNQ